MLAQSGIQPADGKKTFFYHLYERHWAVVDNITSSTPTYLQGYFCFQAIAGGLAPPSYCTP
jgi:hypothetical protein